MQGFVVCIKIDCLYEMEMNIINQNSSLYVSCFIVIYQFYFQFFYYSGLSLLPECRPCKIWLDVCLCHNEIVHI